MIYARVAQLVEYDLAKVGVAGSSPVSRSLFFLGFMRVPGFRGSAFGLHNQNYLKFLLKVFGLPAFFSFLTQTSHTNKVC